MARAGAGDDEDDAAAPDPEEPEAPKRARRSSAHNRRSGPRSVEPWKDRPDPAADPEEGAPAGTSNGEEEGDAQAEREPVYFRARDAWWFEPLVALMVIVVLLAGLTAYTQNFPPVYVVESESMQHGFDDQLGLINTGDLVLAQKVSNSSIVTYIVGLGSGYSTYGEYGDVLLYHPGDDSTVAPVIHRAILYLQYNSASNSYSAPSLSGLPCNLGDTGVYTNTASVNGCGTTHLTADLILHDIGWEGRDVEIQMDPGLLGTHSGYLTMGDNNFASGTDGAGDGIPDQMAAISTLVEPGWIVGVARGMIPWFGAVKLALDGESGEVPTQSWQYLGLTIVGIILAGLALHLYLRSRGVEDPRRREQEDEEEAAEGRPAPKTGLFHRRRPPEGDDGEPDPLPDPSTSRVHRRPGGSDSAGGRPRPKVGRRSTAPPDPEDDDDS